MALFPLRGNLPWKPRPRLEPPLQSQEIVRLIKLQCSGPILSTGLPCEFGELLTYSRTLKFDQLPDYRTIRCSFASLTQRMGYCPDSGPLDWRPCHTKITDHIPDVPEITVPDEEHSDNGHSGSDEIGEDSYFEWDLDAWERQSPRDKDITLPAMHMIPLIVEVQD
ncbi:hypothetical protein AX17_006742 [Amanita inopinata Kibby_2008]|nr:hypothetical protein AX17_006742 [Amanita inopinata Kibby_2008]